MSLAQKHLAVVHAGKHQHAVLHRRLQVAVGDRRKRGAALGVGEQGRHGDGSLGPAVAGRGGIRTQRAGQRVVAGAGADLDPEGRGHSGEGGGEQRARVALATRKLGAVW